MMTDSGISVAIVALALASCGTDGMATDVNKPIAQAQVSKEMNWDQASEIIDNFAKENHFAVQEQITRPQGMVDFAARLFRDDITLVVSKLQNGTIEVDAYPLCVCEVGRRIGLQTAADAAVAELKMKLSDK